MKGKTALTLIEQSIMLLVLALAAALCLQAFVWADAHSRQNTARDQALIRLQSAAEVLKANNGDYTAAADAYGGTANDEYWLLCWDENWAQTPYPGTFQLQATPQTTQNDYLGSALLELRQGETSLCSLTICWQEVAP